MRSEARNGEVRFTDDGTRRPTQAADCKAAAFCLHKKACAFIYYGMRLSKCLGVSFSYVGAVIGAGFATGREVMLYFGRYGIICAALGGALMGLLAGLFLYSADCFYALEKSESKGARTACIAIRLCLYISTYATFLCMISACEEIISSSFGISGVGVWTGLFVSFLGVTDMKIMQRFNLVLVPVILVLLLVLARFSSVPSVGKVSLFKVLLYACMNVMTGGYLLAGQREKFTRAECAFVSLFTAAVFAAAVAVVYAVSEPYGSFSMPVYEFAKAHDLKGVSGGIVYLAVFTTLIGCAKLICQDNSSASLPRWASITMLAISTFIGVRLDFAGAVRVVYPVIGYAGIAYLVFTALLPTAFRLFEKRREMRTGTVGVSEVSSDADNPPRQNAKD